MKKYKIREEIEQYSIFEDNEGLITPPKIIPKRRLSVENKTKIQRAFSSTVRSVTEITEEFLRHCTVYRIKEKLR